MNIGIREDLDIVGTEEDSDIGIMGYRFLCKILSIIYKDELQKQWLQQLSDKGEAMEREKAKNVRENFVALAYSVKKKRNGLWEELEKNWGQDLLHLNNKYTKNSNSVSTKVFFEDVRCMCEDENSNKSSKNPIESLFFNMLHNRKGASNPNLAGITMTIVLSVGYTGSPDFYIGSGEARQILDLCMQCLEYDDIVEYLPKKYFDIDNDGYMTKDVLQLLLVALFSAFRVHFPHKKTDITQINTNRENGHDAVADLMGLNTSDQGVLASLSKANNVAEICKAMGVALREYSENETFPNGKVLALNTFYKIPTFEPNGNSIVQILRADYNGHLRSFVIGTMGSGKSLLGKAVIQCCLPPYNENYASDLGVKPGEYLPLVLDCRKLFSRLTIEDIDLIKEAVFQLHVLAQGKPALQHWDTFSQNVFEYYRNQAEDGKLLLIVEDIACLNRASREVLLEKLRKAEVSCLNILILTQRLINSQMNVFNTYNQVEIIPLNSSLSEKIRALVDQGIGTLSAETYQNLLNSNRHVRALVDRPKYLIELLCYDFHGQFNWDELLTFIIERTITDHMIDHYQYEVTDTDCREFLKFLAAGIAENHNPKLSVSYQMIPQNVLEKQSVYKDNTGRSNDIWKYILENMILIYPNAGISSYTFANSILYHSLIADYYWQLFFEEEQIQNWLVHFNYLSAEDFSTVIVILLRRLAKELARCKEFELYRHRTSLLTLFQAVAGYSISRSDSNELFWCLLALQDILEDDQVKGHISERLLDILQDTYAIGYTKFTNLSDDITRKQSLTEPDSYYRCEFDGKKTDYQ